MAEPAEKRSPKTNASKTGPSAGSPKASAPHDEPQAGEHAAPSCNVGFCPICLAVTAMQPLRPEVIEHLLVAGREFFLAAKAVIDARAEQFSGENGDGSKRGTRLEKIDIG